MDPDSRPTETAIQAPSRIRLRCPHCNYRLRNNPFVALLPYAKIACNQCDRIAQVDPGRSLLLLGSVFALFAIPGTIVAIGSKMSPDLGWLLCLTTWWALSFVASVILLTRRCLYTQTGKPLCGDILTGKDHPPGDPLDKPMAIANILKSTTPARKDQ